MILVKKKTETGWWQGELQAGVHNTCTGCPFRGVHWSSSRGGGDSVPIGAQKPPGNHWFHRYREEAPRSLCTTLRPIKHDGWERRLEDRLWALKLFADFQVLLNYFRVINNFVQIKIKHCCQNLNETLHIFMKIWETIKDRPQKCQN